MDYHSPSLDYRSFAFRIISFSVRFISFSARFGSIQEISGCSCIRPIRMNGREREKEREKKEKKFESMVSGSFRRVNVPHTFYTRRVDSFVSCITNTVLSPAIPSRFSNHRIIYPSCNKRSIRTRIPLGIFDSSVKIVDKHVTLRSLSENKFGGTKKVDKKGEGETRGRGKEKKETRN